MVQQHEKLNREFAPKEGSAGDIGRAASQMDNNVNPSASFFLFPAVVFPCAAFLLLEKFEKV